MFSVECKDRHAQHPTRVNVRGKFFTSFARGFYLFVKSSKQSNADGIRTGIYEMARRDKTMKKKY
jgi:hypothetical protein